MRLLLVLHDPSARDACQDYYLARGCDVDVADDCEHAEALLRFRRYDLLLGDLPLDPEKRTRVLQLTGLARRRNASMVRVLLSGGERVAGDDDLFVLPMPQPLGGILELAARPLDRRHSQR